MYALDTGLLGAMAGISADILVRGDMIFREFEGALVENYVVQELRAAKDMDLYYSALQHSSFRIHHFFPAP